MSNTIGSWSSILESNLGGDNVGDILNTLFSENRSDLINGMKNGQTFASVIDAKLENNANIGNIINTKLNGGKISDIFPTQMGSNNVGELMSTNLGDNYSKINTAIGGQDISTIVNDSVDGGDVSVILTEKMGYDNIGDVFNNKLNSKTFGQIVEDKLGGNINRIASGIANQGNIKSLVNTSIGNEGLIDKLMPEYAGGLGDIGSALNEILEDKDFRSILDEKVGGSLESVIDETTGPNVPEISSILRTLAMGRTVPNPSTTKNVEFENLIAKMSPADINRIINKVN